MGSSRTNRTNSLASVSGRRMETTVLGLRVATMLANQDVRFEGQRFGEKFAFCSWAFRCVFIGASLL